MSAGSFEGFRLSPQQRRVWRLQQSRGGADFPARLVALVEGADGELDAAALERAAGEVARRWEILRTSYQCLPGVALPVQVVGEEARLRFGWTPLGLGRAELTLEAPVLCGDAASLEILLAKIAQGDSDGEPLQYPDLAEWQNQLLEGEETEDGRAVWRAHKDALPAPARLPFAASAAGPFAPAFLPVPLKSGTAGCLAALAEARGTTLQAVLLAGWLAVLHRFCGQEELAVGVGVDGRSYEGLDQALGLLAKYLPLGCRVEPEARFEEVVARAAEALEEVAPWQELFDWDDSEEVPALAAGFDFAERRGPFQAGGSTFSVVRVEAPVEPFAVRLSGVRTAGSLSLELAYDAAALSMEDAKWLADSCGALLSAAAENPRERVGSLGLMGEAGRIAVLAGSAGPAAGFGTGCVHRLFEAHAARQPERTAVVAGDLSLTYAELDARAGALARRLRAAGVGPDKVVALGLEHGLDTIAGLLGTLKAGGAYLPLDPGLPAERRAFMLEDSGAVAVVTTKALVSGLPAGGAEVILLDDLGDAPAADGADPLPGNLVYVLYTSGSTGTPKAVQVEHRQLWNYVHAVGAVLGLPEGASYAMVSTFAADLGNTSLFPALCTGGTLHVVSQERAADAVALAEYFGRHPVDCLKIVPSHLQALLAAGPDTRLLPRRCLVVGGEASRWDWIDEIRSLVPGLRVVNHYGPTETTVGTAAFPFEEEGDRLSAVPPIGRPLANARIHLLDDRFEPVPCWVPAELYVAGAGVARGYLRRPALTAERFLPDPFAPEPGGRLYRTGDLARWLPDGNLEFLGRADDQVKIRGYRVELGEIAAALESHPSVGRAEVLARQDAAGQKRLVAYVATSRKEDLAPAFLRAFLRERLPEFMVPAVIVPLDFLPLTSNGKVDRRALPEPREEAPRKEGGTAPRTPAEEKLARVWKTVLRVGDVGVDDNFFALGGDSILGIQVVARARQEGLVLSPADLFRYQTLAELAQAAVTEAAPSAEPQGPVTGPVPLTPIQRRFFDLDLAEPHHWNQALLLETRRPLERAAVAAAVESLVAHHDALRLRFTREEEGWSQVNGEPGGPVPLDWVDLSALPDGEARTAIEAVSALAQAGFDLSRGPLLRVVLFDLGPGRPGRLLLVAHHLVVDGVSWRVLLDDLGLAYAQAASGGSPELAPKTTSFKRWAERLREHAQSPEAAEELGFWLAQNERPVPPLPVDFSGDTPDTEGEAAHVRVALEPEATEALLRQVPEAYQSQVQEALLAALARAFGRFTGRFTGKNALRLELEGHGREDLFPGVDLSRTVGWFTARFPVTLDLAGAAGPGEALTAVKEQLRRVPRRGAGYGVLRYLRETADAEPLRREPTPEISFNYLGQLDQIVTEDSLFGPARESSGPVRSPAARRTHLLQIDASVEAGRLQATWGYSPRRHRRETVEALAAGFLAELRNLIDHCRSSEAGGYTPSDFPDLELSQLDLDSILDQVGT